MMTTMTMMNDDDDDDNDDNNNNNDNGIHSSISTEWLFICWNLSNREISLLFSRSAVGS